MRAVDFLLQAFPGRPRLTKPLLALYLSTLAFLSLNPWLRPSGEPAVGFIAWDKLDHALAYGGLAVLVILALPKGMRGLARIATAMAISASFGLFTEYCQSWLTETRQFSWADAIANGFGAMIGALGFLVFRLCRGLIRESAENARP
jgi:VanZ family protein